MAEALQEEYDYEEEQFEDLSDEEEHHQHKVMKSPPRAVMNRKNHEPAGSTFTRRPELGSHRLDGEESSDAGVFDGGYMMEHMGMEHMGYGSYGEESGGRLHKDLPRMARHAFKPSASSTVSLRPSHTGSSGSGGQGRQQAGGGKGNLTFKQEQLQNMERENERLLSSMVRIHQRGASGTFSVNQHYVQNARHVASNLINRQKQAREIQRANQMMAARLESVRGTVRGVRSNVAQQTWRAKPQRAERLVQPEWQS